MLLGTSQGVVDQLVVAFVEGLTTTRIAELAVGHTADQAAADTKQLVVVEGAVPDHNQAPHRRVRALPLSKTPQRLPVGFL